MARKESLPTDKQVVNFEMLNELADSIYTEMKEFSKKKPDDALNAFKVKNVNRVLTQLKEFLKDEPTVSFLDLLDDETLPHQFQALLPTQVQVSSPTGTSINPSTKFKVSSLDWPVSTNNEVQIEAFFRPSRAEACDWWEYLQAPVYPIFKFDARNSFKFTYVLCYHN